MKLNCKHTVWVFLAALAWAATASAQQTIATPEPGRALEIEGVITSVSISGTRGPRSLTVKDNDGKEYIVHFGPLAPLRRQGFNPKVGDKITVSGIACCEVEGKLMIHSQEITLAGKTFRTPMTPAQMMRMRPGAQTGDCPECGHGTPMGTAPCPDCPHHEMHHYEMHH